MDVPLLLVMISSAVIISMGAILKDKSLMEMFGKYFPYILWPLLYRLTRGNVNRKLKAALTVIFIAFFAVSVILTLTTLSVDSNASRLLAGKATESEPVSYTHLTEKSPIRHSLSDRTFLYYYFFFRRQPILA